MPTYRDDALVLRTQSLGEADRIVTFLTRNHGRVRAVAKGVRRTASKFGARLEPFMLADVQFYEGRSLDTVTQAETLSPFGRDIVDDYERYTSASVIVETADRLSEHESSLQQYLLAVGALRSLSRREHSPGLIVDSYLLRALSVAGWAPSFEDCARCGDGGPHARIVPQLGGVVCPNCAPSGSARVDPDMLEMLGSLLAGEWDVVEAATEQSAYRSNAFVGAYVQFHLERGLRSMPFNTREALSS